MTRSFVFVVSSLLLLFLARAASAEPSARFRYVRGEGAESCGDEASMRRAVAAQLGYDPFKDDASTAVQATVGKKGERLVGRVEVRRPGEAPGVRELSSHEMTCASLGSAMAFTISIAIDPLAIARPRPSPPPLEPLPAPPSEPPPVEVPHDTPPPVPSKAEGTEHAERPKVRIGLSSHGALGLAPSAALGVGASVGLRWTRLSLAAEGRIFLPARADLSTGGEVHAWTGMGLLAPCVHMKVAQFCAVGAIGSLQGESKDVSLPAEDNGLYAALGARAGVEVTLTRYVALRPEVEALAALVRPSLTLNGRTIWTMPPVSGTAGLVVVMQF
ncbi:hypothetical protein LVJ94_40170 [Pendulispora rubella]|uniref:Uncharacterized protein n=1 Tax=Pendulispora rubella TaxID=2741070 RepID=A0ABZ2KWQ5_9BACT